MMKVMPHPDGGILDGGDASVINTCGANGPALGLGDACQCDAECGSNHCVDGVCCNSACTSGCQTCTAPSSPGTCLARPAKSAPRKASDCVADSPSTCGMNGLCDGAGSCQNYLGNTCVGGTCSGDSVLGAFACDGAGVCKAGVTQMLCLPYSCDTQDGHLLRVLHLRARGPVRPAALLRPRHGELRQGRHRRALQRRRRLHLGLLRRQRLLQRRLQGRLRGVQPPRPAGDLLADRLGKARPARRLQGPGGGELRPQRDLRRRRRLRQVRPGHAVPRAVVLRQPPQHGGDLRRSRHLPAARRPGLPPVPLRQRRLHQGLPDRRRLRPGNRLRPRHDQHDDLRAEATGASLRRPPASAPPASSASTASAARAPAPATCQ